MYIFYFTAPLNSYLVRLGHVRRAHNLFMLAHANLGVAAVATRNDVLSSSLSYRMQEWVADLSGIPVFRHTNTADEIVKSNISMTQSYLMRGLLTPACAALRLAVRAMKSSQASKNFSHMLQVEVLNVLVESYQGNSYSRSRARLEQLEAQFDRSPAGSESRGLHHLATGIVHFSNGLLTESLNSLVRAVVYYERAECSFMVYASIVQRGWVQLLCGNVVSADHDITAASQVFLTGGTNVQLNKWVIELKIVHNICRGMFHEAEVDWEELRVIRKRDDHTATSSALAAYLRMRRGQFIDASTFARYACIRLEEKVVTSAASGVFLFFAGYSALCIVEAVKEQLRAALTTDRQSYESASSLSTQTQVIVSPSQGKRIVEQLKPCVDNVISVLQRACHHIPILSLLRSTLMIMRRRVLEELTSPPEVLTDDEMTCFEFGIAFYNGERAKCLESMGITYRPQAAEARTLANGLLFKSVVAEANAY